MSRSLRRAGEHGQYFMNRSAAVQRGDHGLHYCRSAIERAGVAPGLEKVRLRQMPLTDLRGFIVVKRQVSSEGLQFSGKCQQQIVEIEIGWSGERGVAAEDQQHLHPTCPQVVDQFSQ